MCFFPKDVVESHDFYDMPQQIQLLYFHMASASDDEGRCIPQDILEKLYIPYNYLLPLIEIGYILPLTSDGNLGERTYLIPVCTKPEKKYNTNKQCLYINGILKNRCTDEYDETRCLSALFAVLEAGADMEQITYLCKRIDYWYQFEDLMEAYGVQV